ncbi:hypothetical protein SERN_2771 [Serinibacter arcticus]|uniref:Uncharacterized protein n=1 Tax=Serinibacter arcticus TaxID=1655435 RepID=A0A4Z1DYV1_9MICO|nr:hypothetical protein SERN_2771 [Serinibacter arcticus]
MSTARLETASPSQFADSSTMSTRKSPSDGVISRTPMCGVRSIRARYPGRTSPVE